MDSSIQVMCKLKTWTWRCRYRLMHHSYTRIQSLWAESHQTLTRRVSSPSHSTLSLYNPLTALRAITAGQSLFWSLKFPRHFLQWIDPPTQIDSHRNCSRQTQIFYIPFTSGSTSISSGQPQVKAGCKTTVCRAKRRKDTEHVSWGSRLSAASSPRM